MLFLRLYAYNTPRVRRYPREDTSSGHKSTTEILDGKAVKGVSNAMPCLEHVPGEFVTLFTRYFFSSTRICCDLDPWRPPGQAVAMAVLLFSAQRHILPFSAPLRVHMYHIYVHTLVVMGCKSKKRFSILTWRYSPQRLCVRAYAFVFSVWIA